MDAEEYWKDIQSNRSRALSFKKILIDFGDEYTRQKREKSYLDFSDIEHQALLILEKEPKACEEYRDKFEYILVDEYQDTNEVQETLIGHIARDNNMFMVGDVKQSIYGFRLAEPDIFLGKYKSFEEDDDSTRIDLNVNYRSKQGVIDSVNNIFMSRMTGYDEESRLNRGIEYTGSLGYDTEVHIVETLFDDGEDIDEELANMKNVEIEAGYTANLINSLIGTTIYDSKSEREKTVDYRDIVIIMRGLKGKSDIYARTIADLGIPVYVENNEGYFDTIEISTIENILRVIDNPKQDVPLLAVLYCPVFNFSINELVEIRLHGDKMTLLRCS